MNPVSVAAGTGRFRPMDRRTAIKWIFSAMATITILDRIALIGDAPPKPTGYGSDPDIQKSYKPGELWPLTFTPEQRRKATILCDMIIPADSESPSASQVGVVDFIDEWISAPYLPQGGDFRFALDRALILEGFTWLDDKAIERFEKKFTDLEEWQRVAICDEICYLKTAKYERPAQFFGRFRDLTAGGFYTTPEGTKDLKYVGNTPMARFEGPPLEVLQQVGLA
jgi:hypothetical protein